MIHKWIAYFLGADADPKERPTRPSHPPASAPGSTEAEQQGKFPSQPAPQKSRAAEGSNADAAFTVDEATPTSGAVYPWSVRWDERQHAARSTFYYSQVKRLDR